MNAIKCMAFMRWSERTGSLGRVKTKPCGRPGGRSWHGRV